MFQEPRRRKEGTNLHREKRWGHQGDAPAVPKASVPQWWHVGRDTGGALGDAVV